MIFVQNQIQEGNVFFGTCAAREFYCEEAINKMITAFKLLNGGKNK